MGKYNIIFMTASSPEEARKITDKLLNEKMIACANVIPKVESRYWWEGKIETSNEALVIMKTVEGNFKKIEEKIKEIHSYEVPEIISVGISGGSEEYFRWIDRVIV